MTRVFLGGWKRLGTHKKGVLLAYAVNVWTAFLLFFPFMETFERSLGSGLYRDKLLTELDYDWLKLFAERVEGFASSFSPSVTGFGPFARNLQALLDGDLTSFPVLLVALGGLYILFSTYVVAAFTGSLALDPEGSTSREFLRTGGEFLGRFLRLAVMSVVTFLLVDWLLVEPGRRLVEELSVAAGTDRQAFSWELTLYLSSFFLFLQINMVFEYARIITAAENRTSVFLALCSATRFVYTHWISATGIYLVLGLVGMAAMVGVVLLEAWIPQATWAGIVLALFVQQSYMVFRLALKLSFYSTQMQFFMDHANLPGHLTSSKGNVVTRDATVDPIPPSESRLTNDAGLS